MTTITPYRSAAPDARDGFGPLLHAEWTKFRTVRGWVIGMIVAVLVTAGLGVLVAEASGNVSCSIQTSSGQQGPVQHGAACGQPTYPLGPGGEPVRDEFYFVRQPLAGHGSITVRVTSLTGVPRPEPRATRSRAVVQGRDHHQGRHRPGFCVRGHDGHRRQWRADAVELHPGHARTGRRRLGGEAALAAADPGRGHDPRLRLGRRHALDAIGTVALAGLPSTVQAGLFVTSPEQTAYSSSLGSGSATTAPPSSTAVFDDVRRTGRWPARTWTGDYVGAGASGSTPGPVGITRPPAGSR